MVQDISQKIQRALALANKDKDEHVKEMQRVQSKADKAKVNADQAEKDLEGGRMDLIEQQVTSYTMRLSAQLGQFQDLNAESVHMDAELDALVKEHKTLYEDLANVEKETLAARRQLAIAAGNFKAIAQLSDQDNALKAQEYADLSKRIENAETSLEQQVKLLVHGMDNLEMQKSELESVYKKLGEEIKNHGAGVDDIQDFAKELSAAHASLGISLKEYEKSDARCKQIKVKQVENEHKLNTMLQAQEKLMASKSETEENLQKTPSLDDLEQDALQVEAECMELDRRCSEEDATSCKLLKVNEQELELRLVAVQEKMTKNSVLDDDFLLAATELNRLKPRIEIEQKVKEHLGKSFAEVCAQTGKQDLDGAKQKMIDLERKLSERLNEVKKTSRNLATYSELVSKVDHKIELLTASALSPAEQGIISIEAELAYLKMNAAIASKNRDQVKSMVETEQSNAKSQMQLQERAVDECQKQIQTKIDLLSSAEANIDLLVGKLDSTVHAMIDVQEVMQKLHVSIEPLEDRIHNLVEPLALPQ